LLNLVYEVGPSGIKVIDKGKVHQDHAVAVRGVVASLGTHAIGEVTASNLSVRRTAHAIDPDDPGRPAEYWPGVGDFMGELDYMAREDLGDDLRTRLR